MQFTYLRENKKIFFIGILLASACGRYKRLEAPKITAGFGECIKIQNYSFWSLHKLFFLLFIMAVVSSLEGIERILPFNYFKYFSLFWEAFAKRVKKTIQNLYNE